MFWKEAILVIFFGIFKLSYGKYGFEGYQEWGFSNVRNGAYMFYWLHYTTANVRSYTEKPLIIWLQGGPGVASTGYGNFEEIGPLYLNLTKRQHSLVNDYNVLFIDSPVGTGYSFATSEKYLAKTDNQVATDLFYCIDNFMEIFPAFSNVATYIVGESYGGKIAVHLASKIFRASQYGYDKVNLKGLALGDALISPIDTALSWAPYLNENSLINSTGYTTITEKVRQIEYALAHKNWMLASQHFHGVVQTILSILPDLDVYNIHSKVDPSKPDNYDAVDTITKNLMETEVKRALNIRQSISFNIDSTTIMNALSEDFIKPVTQEVNFLLMKSNLKVFVYNGEWDALVNAKSAESWIQNLDWRIVHKWRYTKQYGVLFRNKFVALHKTVGHLRMYLVKEAGHMVPIDNPVMMKKIMYDLTSDI